MQFLDEAQFNAIFGARLKETRERMNLSRPQFAHSLGITKDQLKRYETRESSGFPLYLLPQLIFLTGRPYSYWISPAQQLKRTHLTLVE
jgi:transcriptional regulator with XRE-family HTH domain